MEYNILWGMEGSFEESIEEKKGGSGKKESVLVIGSQIVGGSGIE